MLDYFTSSHYLRQGTVSLTLGLVPYTTITTILNPPSGLLANGSKVHSIGQQELV
jgi:hypothetical protein